MAVHGKQFLNWEFPEYNKYERGPLWRWVFGLILIGVLVYSILTLNLLFVIFIVLTCIVLFLHSKREALKINFGIFEDGIKIGENFYEWQDINNFRIVYEPPEVKRLYIDLKGTFLHDFSASLEDQDPVEVRKILKNYLEEDLTKPYETLADKLNRWLKI